MAEETCSHISAITSVKHPQRRECEECVKIGDLGLLPQSADQFPKLWTDKYFGWHRRPHNLDCSCFIADYRAALIEKAQALSRACVRAFSPATQQQLPLQSLACVSTLAIKLPSLPCSHRNDERPQLNTWHVIRQPAKLIPAQGDAMCRSRESPRQ